ncbi:methylenetetrahydrofolate--tRNA-(uracil(54)-C(5))-methyltransferase (FADH(2)-oxidizing) TrmFO [bacterium]|nr:methylenetetrahydrofolate--tRNA-(uracil(54)-C(5))-methyltransferase (FADH(2)-oxidizing) TrmFO [bacterium]
MESFKLSIIGAGLAGCEAALFMSRHGFEVTLYEAKPDYISPAHSLGSLAELVCSNSLGSTVGSSSSASLVKELKILGSELISVAETCMVPAGNAIAVDRNAFSKKVTEKIKASGIKLINREITDLTDIPKPVLISTGPMTSPAFSESLQQMLDDENSNLSYFDASAPILTRASLDENEGFWKGRYQDDNHDYFNAVLDKPTYLKFREELINSEKVELKDFEKGNLFEGCLPIEELARRGEDTMRYGPMKPVGLRFPGTEVTPHAVVQLRREDTNGDLLNLVGFQTRLKWGEQKRVFSLIPAFRNAEFIRYGVMHKNIFINSSRLLQKTMNLKSDEDIFFAGQITGTEGYAESIACAFAVSVYIIQKYKKNTQMLFPETTLTGSLLNYVTSSSEKTFQPMKANYGLLEHPYRKTRPKRLRKEKLSQFVQDEMKSFLKQLDL